MCCIFIIDAFQKEAWHFIDEFCLEAIDPYQNSLPISFLYSSQCSNIEARFRQNDFDQNMTDMLLK